MIRGLVACIPLPMEDGLVPWATVEKIAECDTIISHGHCADGSLSAYLLSLLIQRVHGGKGKVKEVIFASYTEIDSLPVRPGIVFCDFFPGGRGDEYNEAGAIVLDHHATAKDDILRFGETRGIYADAKENPGISGASLAWSALHQANAIWNTLRHANALSREDMDALKELTDLIQIRDTWQKEDPRFKEASEISDALRFIPSYDLFTDRGTWIPRYSPTSLLGFLRDLSPVVASNKRAKVEHLVKDAYFFRLLTGLKVAVIPSVSQTSDAMALLEGDVDVVVGFYLTPRGLGLSLRSTGSYNVAALAKENGGGGHFAAAGCSLPLSMDRSPYLQIRELFASHDMRQKGLG